jgi:hypothetical protein
VKRLHLLSLQPAVLCNACVTAVLARNPSLNDFGHC